MYEKLKDGGLTENATGNSMPHEFLVLKEGVTVSNEELDKFPMDHEELFEGNSKDPESIRNLTAFYACRALAFGCSSMRDFSSDVDNVIEVEDADVDEETRAYVDQLKRKIESCQKEIRETHNHIVDTLKDRPS